MQHDVWVKNFFVILVVYFSAILEINLNQTELDNALIQAADCDFDYAQELLSAGANPNGMPLIKVKSSDNNCIKYRCRKLSLRSFFVNFSQAFMHHLCGR